MDGSPLADQGERIRYKPLKKTWWILIYSNKKKRIIKNNKIKKYINNNKGYYK